MVASKWRKSEKKKKKKKKKKFKMFSPTQDESLTFLQLSIEKLSNLSTNVDINELDSSINQVIDLLHKFGENQLDYALVGLECLNGYYVKLVERKRYDGFQRHFRGFETCFEIFSNYEKRVNDVFREVEEERNWMKLGNLENESMGTIVRILRQCIEIFKVPSMFQSEEFISFLRVLNKYEFRNFVDYSLTIVQNCLSDYKRISTLLTENQEDIPESLSFWKTIFLRDCENLYKISLDHLNNFVELVSSLNEQDELFSFSFSSLSFFLSFFFALK